MGAFQLSGVKVQASQNSKLTAGGKKPASAEPTSPNKFASCLICSKSPKLLRLSWRSITASMYMPASPGIAKLYRLPHCEAHGGLTPVTGAAGQHPAGRTTRGSDESPPIPERLQQSLLEKPRHDASLGHRLSLRDPLPVCRLANVPPKGDAKSLFGSSGRKPQGLFLPAGEGRRASWDSEVRTEKKHSCGA